jgi:hypothetical protein
MPLYASHKSNLTQRLAAGRFPPGLCETRQESLRGGVPPVLSRYTVGEPDEREPLSTGGLGVGTPRSGFCLRQENRNSQILTICRFATYQHLAAILIKSLLAIFSRSRLSFREATPTGKVTNIIEVPSLTVFTRC